MTESVGADILLEAHRLVTGPRNDSYGNVVDDYSKVIHIFEGLTGIKLSLSDALLFMVSVKMARLRTNLDKNRLHHDSSPTRSATSACSTRPTTTCRSRAPWQNDESPTLRLPSHQSATSETCLWRETRR
jgi:hypothetical protein